VEALGERMTPALQVELAEEVDRLVDTLTRTYVRAGAGAGQNLAALVARDRPAFLALAEVVEDAMPRVRRAERLARVERWTDLGVEPSVAAALASLRELSVVPEVAAIAAETGAGVPHVGEVLWRLSEALPFDDLAARLAGIRPQGSWQYWQRRGLSDELRDIRRVGAMLVVRAHPGEPPAEAVTKLLAERAAARRRTRILVAALERDDPGLDGVAVVVRSLRDALT
jgi:NAD-specific glutamate dehydrogenase